MRVGAMSEGSDWRASHMGRAVYSTVKRRFTAPGLSKENSLRRSIFHVCAPRMLKARVSVIGCMAESTGRGRSSPSEPSAVCASQRTASIGCCIVAL